VDSVHTTAKSAHNRATSINSADASSIKVELHELKDGTAVPNPESKEADAPKAATKSKGKAPAAAAEPVSKAAKKTKTPAEQRADNAEKPGKPTDEDLPENIKRLLAGHGDALAGMTIVVSGVPPTIGRKNTEKLVKDYGGKLTSSLSKNTSYVVLGNDAGPKKLEKIEELGIETLDEDELVAMLEGRGGGVKRGAEDDGEKIVKKKK
jgi:replication factor C subunit 1